MNEKNKQKIDFYTELINKNNSKLKELFDYSFIEFCELNFLKNEILTCQLFELYQSSIFSTNHFLERMIKLSLIKRHTIGHNYSDIESYSIKLKESETKYDGLVLFESLKKALEKALITSEQHDYLINAKNNFRNPYSHAQISKVIKNDNDVTGFMFSISDVQEKLKQGKPLNTPKPTIVPKFSPAIAQMLQENNSKEFAFDYFKNVIVILKEIENKITQLKEGIH